MHTRSYELWILLDPQDQFSDKLLNQDPNRLEKHHKTLDRHDTATKGRDVPEPGQPAQVRPVGLGTTWKMPSSSQPTLGENPSHPEEGRCQMARSPGRPA